MEMPVKKKSIPMTEAIIPGFTKSLGLKFMRISGRSMRIPIVKTSRLKGSMKSVV